VRGIPSYSPEPSNTSSGVRVICAGQEGACVVVVVAEASQPDITVDATELVFRQVPKVPEDAQKTVIAVTVDTEQNFVVADGVTVQPVVISEETVVHDVVAVLVEHDT
jgi:hypothetical protein